MEKSLSTPDNIGASVLDERLFTEKRKLGEGTYAEVFRISSPEKPRKCNAVKRAEGENRKQLQREWKMLKTLDHPNIVKVTQNFWTSPTRSFMLMEYVEGSDLFGLIENRRAPPLAIIHISSSILNALAYLHANNIFHKDLKLENILIGARDINRVTLDTTVKLCDFGLSTYCADNDTRAFAGTMEYAAPEVFERTVTPSAPADIYSFSVVYYALCFSMLPYGDSVFTTTNTISLSERMAVAVAKANFRRDDPFTDRRYRKVYKHTSRIEYHKRYTAVAVLKMSLFSSKRRAVLTRHPTKAEKLIIETEASTSLHRSLGTSEGSM